MSLLQVVYVLPMTRLRLICDIYCDVCDSISQVRVGLGSHMKTMHVKKHNPFCRKEGFLGCSEEKSQRHLYKSRPALKLHENDRLTCDECNYKFELQSTLGSHVILDIKEKTMLMTGVGTVTREAKIVVHRESRLGALKHSCDQCEPWFPFTGILMNHTMHPSMKVLSILVMIVIMKQAVWNT